MKNHCEDDYKAFKGSVSTPTSTSTQDSELSKKDKKKKYYQSKRHSREPRNSSMPASGVNVAKVGGGGQSRKNKKDINGVTCFKKEHFSNKCLESSKN